MIQRLIYRSSTSLLVKFNYILTGLIFPNLRGGLRMKSKRNTSPSGRLKRQLGLADAITIGLGAVIGADIFVVSVLRLASLVLLC